MQVTTIGKKVLKKQEPNVKKQDPAIASVPVEEDIDDEDEKTIAVSEKENNIDLSQKKNGGVLTYNMEDIEIKKIFLEKNVCVRIITNNAGNFVDVRKYYKGYPTKRGIRISIEMFKKLLKIIKDDII